MHRWFSTAVLEHAPIGLDIVRPLRRLNTPIHH